MDVKYFKWDKLNIKKSYNFRIGYRGEGKDHIKKIIETLTYKKSK